MNAIAPNIVHLDIKPRTRKSRNRRQRFNIQEFTNRGGSTAWRVTGTKRDGKTRVRENFSEQAAANLRKIELDTEYAQGHTETAVKETTLTRDQVRLSESAVMQLGEDWPRLLDAVVYWQQNGKKRAIIESPRIDDATEQYLTWLDKVSPFRDATKRHWKTRIKVFRNSVPNMRVADVTKETIRAFLGTRKVSPSGKDTDRRAVSRFFSWCMEDGRDWAITNPCKGVEVAMGEAETIKVLTLEECKKLLSVAKSHGLVPYVAVCIFGGLRPFEAMRLTTWDSVNLVDREILLAANQVKTGRKTGRGRKVAICDTLYAWLKAHKGEEFYPANWRKKFDAVKLAAGFGTKDDELPDLKEWPVDVMRHTAISHYFRNTGSYGLTAEQFGTSEAIIKKHYDGKVSTADTKKFYALRPKGSMK